MANRVLHFTSIDDDSGEEYIVVIEEGDDSTAEDHAMRGFKLYAEGECDLYGRVESSFPFGEVLMKRR